MIIKVQEFSRKPELHWPALVWFISACVADVLITAVLVMVLVSKDRCCKEVYQLCADRLYAFGRRSAKQVSLRQMMWSQGLYEVGSKRALSLHKSLIDAFIFSDSPDRDAHVGRSVQCRFPPY